MVRGILLALIAATVAGTAARCIFRYDDPLVAKFDSSRQGHFDFHNGTYFPVRAFLAGVSPYGQHFADEYPVTRPLPLVSPLLLLLHAPLGLISVEVAEWTYFVLNLAMLAALAAIATAYRDPTWNRINTFLSLLLLVLASRAGHTTLFTGYSTAELVLGTWVALRYAASRPWVSALGVAVTSCKPTYAIPLFLLMVARGDRKAALQGLGLSIVGLVISAGWLVSHSSIQQLRDDIVLAQTAHMEDPYELPVNTWTRIDSLALVAKWSSWAPGELVHLAAMCVLLILPAVALRRLDIPRANAQLSTQDRDVGNAIIAASVASTIYHHVYDALLLFPAIVILMSPVCAKVPIRIRAMLAGLLLFVTWNYVSSDQFLTRFVNAPATTRMLTSTGPIALFAAWLGVCLLPWILRPRFMIRIRRKAQTPT